ncbi:unnamed protein product, partial [Prorocentrum cordatum]
TGLSRLRLSLRGCASLEDGFDPLFAAVAAQEALSELHLDLSDCPQLTSVEKLGSGLASKEGRTHR